MQVCNRCVMSDESDLTIIFDEQGVCNYCTNALKEINTTTYFHGEAEKEKLNIGNPEYEAIMLAPTHQHEEYRTEKIAPILHRILG